MPARTRLGILLVLVAAGPAAGCGGGGHSPIPVVPSLVDQSFLPTNLNDASSADTGYTPAQTFTVGTTGALTGVDVLVYRIAGSGHVTLDVRPTSAGLPVSDDTQALASVEFDVSDFSTSATLAHFDFPIPVPVSQGEVLAIVIRDTVYGSGQLLGWYGTAFPGPYDGGEQCGRPGTYDQPFVVEFSGQGDLGFQTWVLPTVF